MGPLLFLIYINDLNKAIKFCTTHHFADDTNLLYVNKSLKKIQNCVNLDLRSLCGWLKANRISLNASKTELILFRDPRKQLTHDTKFKIDGKKLIPSKTVKYLGVLIDCHLAWHAHIIDLKTKLSRAIGMLYKIRHYVNFDTLRMIYFGIFSSILTYSCQIWGQNDSVVNKLQILQNKAVRCISFRSSRSHASPLYKECSILKLIDQIKLINFLYVHDSLNNNLPTILNGEFSFVDTIHNTRKEMYFQVKKIKTKTSIYGTNSIKSKAAEFWNELNLLFYHVNLYGKSKSFYKKIIYKVLLESY